MKYVQNILISLVLLTGLVACEKELPVYESTVCQLNFKYGTANLTTDEVTEEMRIRSHSFVLNSGEGVMIDTVWVKVTSMGYLSDTNRTIELQQLSTGKQDAVAGKHYVSFDDPELKSRYYFLPANRPEVEIPIVVKRDPSLATDGDVSLKFTFKENENFKLGYPQFAEYTIIISDRLSKPSMWTDCELDYYLGAYGSKKHELMISWTGEIWDNTYINTLFYQANYSGTLYWVPKDGNYMDYLAGWFADKLLKENAERLADPTIGDVYRESDGSPVDFTRIP